MSPRRVVLHVGTERTGSTSIQRTIAANGDHLREHGFLFTEPEGPQQSAKTRTNWKRLDDSSWDDLEAQIRAVEPGQTLIISNEAMYRTATGLPSERLAGLFVDFEVSVVLYVREQAEYIQSMLLHNQKNRERASDFTRPDEFEELLRRRNLNYTQMCKRLERVFGDGTVVAKAFAQDALSANDVVIDFFETIGFPAISELDIVRASNSSLTVEMATALRDLINEDTVGARYADLLDAALRLSHNGRGSPYFLSPYDVESIRARFAESNRRFAENYLANATSLPMLDVSRRASNSGLAEDKAELVALAEMGPRLAGQWLGGRNIGRRLFVEGWDTRTADRQLSASIAGDEAVLRFRSPFNRAFERREQVAVALVPSRKTDASAHCAVEVNETDVGLLDLTCEPIVFDSSLLEPDDVVEIKIRPHGGHAGPHTWFGSVEISHR